MSSLAASHDRDSDLTIDQLSQCKLCKDLSKSELQMMITAMDYKEYKPGESLIAQNDRGEEVFFILSGEVEVTIRILEEEGMETLARLRAGETVGEFALARSARRSAFAKVVTPVSVLVTNRDRLESIFEKNPRIAWIVYRNLANLLVHMLRRTNMIARSAMAAG